jgi:hypothetical protein
VAGSRVLATRASPATAFRALQSAMVGVSLGSVLLLTCASALLVRAARHAINVMLSIRATTVPAAAKPPNR